MHPRSLELMSIFCSESDVCIFVFPDASRAVCERGFWVGNVTARHQSRTDSGDQTLMWHPPFNWPAGLTRASSALTHENSRTRTRTHTTHAQARLHSQTDSGADRHSMIEKHLQGPDSIILALKRSTDDDVVALCHYDEKHNVSDASSFI